MTPAVLSLTALLVAIVVSCFTRLNVGVLSIALAGIIGVYSAKLSANDVLSGFPSQLFVTITGVTLLFGMAAANGTLDRLAHHAVRLCRGNRGVIPIMFFLMALALASIGPGNIATAALIAPMAMATAGRTGIPLFLMAIMVGNGANAGSISPFAPTGIIVSSLMSRIGLSGHEGETYLYNAVAHAIVGFGGYLIFGGWRLFRREAGGAAANDVPITTDPPFEKQHWISIAVITLLVASVMLFKVNVGLGSYVGAVLLVLLGAADDVEALKKVPWGVIVMVCGVSVLIALLEKTSGLDLFVNFLARFATSRTVSGVVAFVTGVISVYSSTSGVVLPAFLPMVPGLATKLSADAFSIATSMNIGAHLVDVSPLSTIGALCIAAAPVGSDSRDLFLKMLAWGLAMSVVGGVGCLLFFR